LGIYFCVLLFVVMRYESQTDDGSSSSWSANIMENT
jgi:hypothetical protein